MQVLLLSSSLSLLISLSSSSSSLGYTPYREPKVLPVFEVPAHTMSFEQKLDMIMKQVPTTTTATTSGSSSSATVDQMKPVSITTPKSVKIIGPTTSRLNLSPLPSKTTSTTSTNTTITNTKSNSSTSTFTPKSILSNKDESKKKSVKIMVPSDKDRENVAHIANTKGRSPMKSSLVSSNKNRVTISEPTTTTTATSTATAVVQSATTSTKSSSGSSSNPFATLLG